MKSKPHSRFVVHATPLHSGPVDISKSANEKGDEQLEMKTFGKSDTVNCKGILSYTSFLVLLVMLLAPLLKVKLCLWLILINMLRTDIKTETSYLKLNML